MEKFPEGQVQLVNLPGSGSLLKRSWDLYQEIFPQSISFALLAFLGVIADKSLGSFFHYIVRDSGASAKSLTEVLVFGIDLAAGIYLAIIFAGMMKLFHEAARGKMLSVSECISYGLSRARSVFWVGILLTVIMYAAIPTVIFFLLFSIWFYFALYIAALGEERGINALLKSRYITHGLFFRVTGRYAAVLVVMAIAVFVPYLFLGLGTVWVVIAPIIILIAGLATFPMLMMYEYFRFVDLLQLPRNIPFVPLGGDRAATIAWAIVGSVFFCIAWIYMLLGPSIQTSISNALVGAAAKTLLPYSSQMEKNLEKLQTFVGKFYYEFEPVGTEKNAPAK